ncbi:ATP-binding protein [Actinoplanes auranticolor]|nr:ATP-binding protein [Actinoplanes auranticolor]
MQVRAPYLFNADDRHHTLSVTGDVTTGVVEMAVHGRWSQRLGMDVSTAIRKCLAEHPAAVIADLRDTDDPDGASMPMWLAAGRAGIVMQPPVPLALCLPTATMLDRRLRRLGAQHPSVFTTMPEARTAVISRLSPTVTLQATLLPQPASPDTARDLVTHACQDWHLPKLRQRAQLVLSELVANAVQHAGTAVLVTVSQRGTGLHLAVRDGTTRLPRLLGATPSVAGQPPYERGNGLRMVHVCATAWGAMPTPGGKVVWATVLAGPPVTA